VSNRRPTLPEGRTAAVEELFVALDAVMHTYRTLPDHERDQRMSLDARRDHRRDRATARPGPVKHLG
jgi:hypothetical protein